MNASWRCLTASRAASQGSPARCVARRRPLAALGSMIESSSGAAASLVGRACAAPSGAWTTAGRNASAERNARDARETRAVSSFYNYTDCGNCNGTRWLALAATAGAVKALSDLSPPLPPHAPPPPPCHSTSIARNIPWLVYRTGHSWSGQLAFDCAAFDAAPALCADQRWIDADPQISCCACGGGNFEQPRPPPPHFFYF